MFKKILVLFLFISPNCFALSPTDAFCPDLLKCSGFSCDWPNTGYFSNVTEPDIDGTYFLNEVSIDKNLEARCRYIVPNGGRKTHAVILYNDPHYHTLAPAKDSRAWSWVQDGDHVSCFPQPGMPTDCPMYTASVIPHQS